MTDPEEAGQTLTDPVVGIERSKGVKLFERGCDIPTGQGPLDGRVAVGEFPHGVRLGAGILAKQQIRGRVWIRKRKQQRYVRGLGRATRDANLHMLALGQSPSVHGQDGEHGQLAYVDANLRGAADVQKRWQCERGRAVEVGG